jgi:hypothetical protein
MDGWMTHEWMMMTSCSWADCKTHGACIMMGGWMHDA